VSQLGIQQPVSLFESFLFFPLKNSNALLSVPNFTAKPVQCYEDYPIHDSDVTPKAYFPFT